MTKSNTLTGLSTVFLIRTGESFSIHMDRVPSGVWGVPSLQIAVILLYFRINCLNFSTISDTDEPIVTLLFHPALIKSFPFAKISHQRPLQLTIEYLLIERIYYSIPSAIVLSLR